MSRYDLSGFVSLSIKKMKDFKNLRVWKHAFELSYEIHVLTSDLHWRDKYVIDQIRRSAYSISTNIAEGCGKNSTKEQARYFQIGFGSATEVEHHLLYMNKLDLISKDLMRDLNSKTIDVKKMLSGLIKFKRSS